jgi:hypothetical protein
MPLVTPQTYAPVKAYFDDVAAATPEWRAQSVETAIALSKRDVVSAGFVETKRRFKLWPTRRCVRVRPFYGCRLQPDRADAGRLGSGWASKSFNELRLVNPEALAGAAIDTAAKSKTPAAIEPGKYCRAGARRTCRPPCVHGLLCRCQTGG